MSLSVTCAWFLPLSPLISYCAPSLLSTKHEGTPIIHDSYLHHHHSGWKSIHHISMFMQKSSNYHFPTDLSRLMWCTWMHVPPRELNRGVGTTGQGTVVASRHEELIVRLAQLTVRGYNTNTDKLTLRLSYFLNHEFYRGTFNCCMSSSNATWEFTTQKDRPIGFHNLTIQSV